MKSQRFKPWVWLAVAALAGCASGPPAPDWQVNAHSATERATRADLRGLDRVAATEWRQALSEVASTATPNLLATVELRRCAVRQAALDYQYCEEHQTRWPELAPDLLAYRLYLAGQPAADGVERLPEQHRAVARFLLAESSAGTPKPEPAALLQNMADPLARLVAASVVFRAGRLTPDVLVVATETAAQQGWRRPLLAWLLVAEKQSVQAGDLNAVKAATARLRALKGQP